MPRLKASAKRRRNALRYGETAFSHGGRYEPWSTLGNKRYKRHTAFPFRSLDFGSVRAIRRWRGRCRRADRRGLQAHGTRSPCLAKSRQQYAGAEPLPADLRSRSRHQLLGRALRAAAPRRREAACTAL